MQDCCILFLYHCADKVTYQHLQLIKKHNPGVPVVLLSDAKDKIPGTIEVDGRWEMKNAWRNIDAEVYNWYEGHRSVQAERYIILEWDCLCTTSVRSFYKSVWDCDLAAAEIRTMGDGWHWFKEYDRVDPLTPCGVVPFAGSLISNRLLQKISEGPVFQDVFCELRLGSLAVSHNAKFGLTPDRDKFLSAVTKEVDDCIGPGIYHAVKTI